MSKQARPWTRQQRKAMKRAALVGEWKSYCRWFMFAPENRPSMHAGHGRDLLASELQRTKRCPVCKSAPMQCPHITLDVYAELSTRLVPVGKQKAWPFSWAGRAP